MACDVIYFFGAFPFNVALAVLFFGKLDASILEVSSSISSMAKRAAGQLPDVGLSA